jgi:hypothetical protein
LTYGGASGANIVTIPDNVADAWNIVDNGGTTIEYVKIITTDAQPEIRFNDGGVDVDFRVEASGVSAALFVQGDGGQVEMGADCVVGGSLSVGHGGSPGTVLDIRSSDPVVRIRNTDALAIGQFMRVQGEVSTGIFGYVEVGVGPYATNQGYVGMAVRNGASTTEQARLNYLGYWGVGTSGPARRLHAFHSDTSTAVITYLARLQHNIDAGSTAANNIGSGLEYSVEDAGGGNNVAGASAVILTDASAGAEDGAFVWRLMSGGAAHAEKARLTDAGIFNASTGVRVGYAIANVSSPPTDAEVDAIWGAPATVGDAFLGIINDNDADTDIWIVTAAGAVWAATQLTVLV